MDFSYYGGPVFISEDTFHNVNIYVTDNNNTRELISAFVKTKGVRVQVEIKVDNPSYK